MREDCESSRVIIFGCSKGGIKVFQALQPGEEVIAFADNDRSKQAAAFFGYRVLDPDRIPDVEFDQILIASHYSDEICDQLLSIGIPASKIILISREFLSGKPIKQRQAKTAFALMGIMSLHFLLRLLAIFRRAGL